MDTTDPDIQFDEKGVCNHCKRYDKLVKERVFTGREGEQKLDKLIDGIKTKGENKGYDCIIGVSGGVDSTFVAYKVKKIGLRPLAVHLDNGWNSELAVSNVKKVLEKLNIDLYTYVLNWEKFKNLQLSFLKASVPDAEVPTDHAILALLYRVAVEKGIKYIISGGNIATEGILPSKWAYGAKDWKYIKGIHKRLGKTKLNDFPHYNFFNLFYYLFVKGIKEIRILNYISYNKKKAMEILEKELDWKYYGGKHYESIYTRFLQAYILPRKFGIDKRKAHLSTLICSGQITREKALEEIKHDFYPAEGLMREDKEYIIKKLGITNEEFEEIMSLPVKTFRNYPSNYWLIQRINEIRRILKKLK